MATPRIYSYLQQKLSRFFWGFSVAGVIFFVLSVACLFQAPKESDVLPIEVTGYLAFGAIAAFMVALSMISSYQQDSKIRSIPIVGRVHKTLISKSTPWSEALHINFMVLICVFLVGFLGVFFGVF